jgi:ADP-ribose pyrophosphatase YjhB (NUDIX family)
MQEKFIKSSIYVVVAILALILFISQPYNFFCKASKLCNPIMLSSIVPRKVGKQELNYKFSAEIPESLKQNIEFYPKKELDSEEQLGVCVIILDKNHKNILLGKRLNSYRAGTYGLPGGRLNKKETLIEGARRELVEETSLIANKLQYVGVIREYQEDNNFNFIHFVYSCDDFSGIPKTVEPDKCEGWRWYPLDTLPENLIKGHRWALDMYRKKSSTLCDIID